MRKRRRTRRTELLALADSLATRLEEICRACGQADIAGDLPSEISGTILNRAHSTALRYRRAVCGENYE